MHRNVATALARPARATLLLAPITLAAALVACDAGDADFGGEDLGPDRFAILSEEGALRMGLTDQFVYFALSDSIIEMATADVEEEMDTTAGLGSTISNLVRGGVSRALQFRMKYPLSEIRDIRWENDRMVVEFTDGADRIGGNFEENDKPLEESFSREDVEAFAAEFRKAKGGGGQVR